jgi:hypothetical protein
VLRYLADTPRYISSQVSGNAAGREGDLQAGDQTGRVQRRRLPAVRYRMLYDLDQDQALLIFTATPGSDSHDKLQLLSVIGAQKLRSRS